MMAVLRYAFEEALVSLWRGRRSGWLSTATIGVALFVLGGFLLFNANLDTLSAEWSRAAEMSVYLHDDATAADRAQVERLLADRSIVASVEFVSKDAALQRFKKAFADLSPTVDSLDTNPLPASYEARLTPGSQTDQALERLGASLRKASGVVDVRFDRQWLDRLLSAVAVVRVVGWALGATLTCAAALTIANVVHLALYARQDEIAIMRLVGAPTAFVRGPFILEGVLQGGLGALLALLVLAVGFLAVRERYLVPIAAAVNLSSVGFLSLGQCALLLIGGMVVGCLGGLLASRQA